MAAAAVVLRGYVIPGCSYEERAGGRFPRHLIIIITKLQELLQHTITITSPPEEAHRHCVGEGERRNNKA